MCNARHKPACLLLLCCLVRPTARNPLVPAATGAHPFVQPCAFCGAVSGEVPVQQDDRALLCVELAVGTAHHQHKSQSPMSSCLL